MYLRGITHVETNNSVAARPFDKGSYPIYIPRVNRIPEKHGANVTLFMIGDDAKTYDPLNTNRLTQI